jgi:2-methylcitrate dehydratase PrpD
MGVAANDIEHVQVGTYGAALEVARYERPRTPAEARFSLKYVVATALTHGSVRLAAFEPARIEDPLTRSVMDRTSVSVDRELDAAFPQQRAARVSIIARGRSAEHMQPTRIGDPDAPLSDAQLNEKYLELAVPVIGDGKAKALLDRLWKLESEKSLRP